MRQYKAIIVDDEVHALDTLRSYIQKTPSLRLGGSYENPLEALEILSGNQPPDIAFLDIDMPELSGLVLAKLTSSKVQVVFTSAHEQYALDAFGVNAVDYLLKPFSFERFLITVQKVCKKITKAETPITSMPLFFKANVKGKIIRIMSDKITYIEAMLNYIKIYTIISETPKIIYLSLKEAESKLGGTNLIRINRSFVINTTFLEVVEGNRITMSNGERFIVGPSYKTSFHAYLNANTIGGKQ
ncbi:LytR/AlgR family response regulator transcription factor [Pedobacter steynii]